MASDLLIQENLLNSLAFSLSGLNSWGTIKTQSVLKALKAVLPTSWCTHFFYCSFKIIHDRHWRLVDIVGTETGMQTVDFGWWWWWWGVTVEYTGG